MKEICYKQHGKCDGCPLNVVEDWQELKTTWCLISLKESYAKEYINYIAENNEILAERVKQRYEELEKKYLKQL